MLFRRKDRVIDQIIKVQRKRGSEHIVNRLWEMRLEREPLKNFERSGQFRRNAWAYGHFGYSFKWRAEKALKIQNCQIQHIIKMAFTPPARKISNFIDIGNRRWSELYRQKEETKRFIEESKRLKAEVTKLQTKARELNKEIARLERIAVGVVS